MQPIDDPIGVSWAYQVQSAVALPLLSQSVSLKKTQHGWCIIQNLAPLHVTEYTK